MVLISSYIYNLLLINNLTRYFSKVYSSKGGITDVEIIAHYANFDISWLWNSSRKKISDCDHLKKSKVHSNCVCNVFASIIWRHQNSSILINVRMQHYTSIFILLTAYLNPLLKTAVSMESARLIGTLMSLTEVVMPTTKVLHLNLHHTC